MRASGTPGASRIPARSSIAALKNHIIGSIKNLPNAQPLQLRETELFRLKIELDARKVKLESRERELNIREIELNTKLDGLKDTLQRYEERLQRLEAALNGSGQLANLKDLTWDSLGISRKDLAAIEKENKSPLDMMMWGLRAWFLPFAKNHSDKKGDNELFIKTRTAYDKMRAALDRIKVALEG